MTKSEIINELAADVDPIAREGYKRHLESLDYTELERLLAEKQQ
ncbi:MAG: hypothetical protein ACYSTI_13720 [Planctomycetota bacterium]|jgi:hypothetical protein